MTTSSQGSPIFVLKKAFSLSGLPCAAVQRSQSFVQDDLGAMEYSAEMCLPRRPRRLAFPPGAVTRHSPRSSIQARTSLSSGIG